MAIPSKTEKVPEMVERVARALATAAGGKIAGPGKSLATTEFGWGPDGAHMRHYVDRHWREHVHAARFAIEAMRNPQGVNVSEVYAAVDKADPECGLGPASLLAAWQTMIDEALK